MTVSHGRSTWSLGQMEATALRAHLEAALIGPTLARAPSGEDSAAYLEGLRADIRAAACDPEWIEATVMPPAFPFAAVGERIAGFCVAHASGYWLVYEPQRQTYLCFWGSSTASLGARGIFGDPVYCWSS
jgi:hypothetical protein